MWRVLEEGAQAGLAFSASHQTHRLRCGRAVGQTDALLSGFLEAAAHLPTQAVPHPTPRSWPLPGSTLPALPPSLSVTSGLSIITPLPLGLLCPGAPHCPAPSAELQPRASPTPLAAGLTPSCSAPAVTSVSPGETGPSGPSPVTPHPEKAARAVPFSTSEPGFSPSPLRTPRCCPTLLPSVLDVILTSAGSSPPDHL